jgi:hypothetical protein
MAWATVVAAVGGSLIGGLITLVGVYLQNTHAMQRLQTEAEAAAIVERKQIYLTFLTCVLAHHEGIVSAETKVGHDQWFRGEYLGRHYAVLLEGQQDVVVSARRLHDLLRTVREEAEAAPEDWRDAYHAAYATYDASIDAAITAVESAMGIDDKPVEREEAGPLRSHGG